jgi:hypothetical protein
MTNLVLGIYVVNKLTHVCQTSDIASRRAGILKFPCDPRDLRSYRSDA